MRHTKNSIALLAHLLTPIAICAVCAQPFKAQAQQFGLKPGESVAAIRAKGISLTKENQNLWRTKYLPYGNKSFDDYWLLITPKTGLCKIIAWMPSIQDSKYGDATKSKYEALKEALTKKYGAASNNYDFLRSGALWKEHQEWMRSLFHKERILASFWNDINKNGVQNIALKASGSSPNSSLINISYEFTNVDQCLSENKAIDSSNL